MRWLAKHVNYLTVMAVTGWLSFITIVVAHIVPETVSPLLVVIAYFYFIYGIFVIPIKHHFYYSTNTQFNAGFRRGLFNVLVNYIPFLLVIMIPLTMHYGNDLHLLPKVPEGLVITEGEFRDSLHAKLDSTESVYFLASYGGGLKANAWNLLLLESWRKDDSHGIDLDKCVAMSGVSGGALGQAFYSAILKNRDKDDVQPIINTLAETNFLSIDLTYLLGFDLIRELDVLSSSFRDDRAKRSMAQYASVIGDPEINEIAYRSYWAEYWNTRKNTKVLTPALIMNSTGTHQKQGVACSVKLDDFNQAFPEADNLVEFDEGVSLSYGHVVSCANRFPIFSPAAKIRGKGHYVDGGYFENSGLLSALNFYDYLSDELNNGKRKIHFVVVINDKRAYAERILRDIEIKKVEKESGELQAIFNTLMSLSIWPDYLREKLAQNPDTNLVVKEVYLPYRLTIDQIESYTMGCIEDDDLRQRITAVLDSNNQVIHDHLNAYVGNQGDALGWNVIEPPLGRILTKPAVEYMRAMIESGLCYVD